MKPVLWLKTFAPLIAARNPLASALAQFARNRAREIILVLTLKGVAHAGQLLGDFPQPGRGLLVVGARVAAVF